MSLTAPEVTERTVEHNETTMRAIVQRRYGTADVLHLEELERPVPGPDEVLVRVRAAGLDRGTWHFMTGVPYLGRLAFGLRVPKNPVLGLDVAGTVEAVGSKVTRFKAGDDVFGTGKGTFAEYTVGREDKLAPKPPSLTFEEAAVVPVSGSTALQGLRECGRIQMGQRVLIVGASGGVGSYAVQLAKALGAEVTGVASTGKLELVRSMGADHTIDYTTEDFADGSRRYDLIIDIGGRRKVSILRRALAPKGTLVLLGGEEGGRLSGGMGRQLRALVLSIFVDQRLTMFVAKQNRGYLDALSDFIETGRLIPSIDRTYPLDEMPDAMRRLETGQVRGKIAITL